MEGEALGGRDRVCGADAEVILAVISSFDVRASDMAPVTYLPVEPEFGASMADASTVALTLGVTRGFHGIVG